MLLSDVGVLFHFILVDVGSMPHFILADRGAECKSNFKSGLEVMAGLCYYGKRKNEERA